MFGSIGALHASGAAAIVAIPATTAGDELGWLLNALNGDGPALTRASLKMHFSPAFLTGLPIDPARLSEHD